METIRLILFVVLAFLLLQIWEAWNGDQQPQGVEVVSTTPLPVINPDLPNQPVGSSATDITDATQRFLEPAAPTKIPGKQVTISTDTLLVVMDSRGAVPHKVSLKNYPVSQDLPDQLTVMLDDVLDKRFFLQTGTVASAGQLRGPNHSTLFDIAAGDYSLQEGEDQLTLVAVAALENGLRLRKEWHFYRGSYQVQLVSTLSNDSSQPWQGAFYNQLVRTPGDGAERSFLTPASYEGAAYFTPESKYQKTDYEEIIEEPLALPTDSGWVAMLEHYFVAAVIPQDIKQFYTKALSEGRFAVGTVGPTLHLQPGEQVVDTATFYIGPKEQNRLNEVATGLELTTDFGLLTFLAEPLFWLLSFLHGLFGNWGWAIIGVTVSLKALFYPLSAVGYRSMARMKGVQPKMLALREAYAEDKTLLNQKMMELYRNEKINPLGGCLPILIQIPVFIALYWVLLESVELRQASFIFWLTDLSQSDPYYVLPIIMGISMVIQQRLNPAQMDPIQQKVMMAMPVVFTFFFLMFPAGLVLYWVVNNVLSILQQWSITRKYEAA
ncbi:MAG: membrane protein insertase YidC [Immundisolibacteraceae bacterium]|nr:membrane protein insertase YidC [Immundisolibacteraceae bacterium]